MAYVMSLQTDDFTQATVVVKRVDGTTRITTVVPVSSVGQEITVRIGETVAITQTDVP